MLLKFFQIPARGDADAEQSLTRFLQSHKVVTVDREFIHDGANSAWAICVTYLVSAGAQAGKAARRGGPSKVDYKAVLNATDFELFSRLRELRGTLFRSEGVPAYQVFTDAQLADIARQRPTSKTALGQLEGIGESRVQKYGDSIIERVLALVSAHNAQSGRGLPIGALTSQHFANFYLAGADRLLLEQCRVRGMVRYMDDILWWSDSRADVVRVLGELTAYLDRELDLRIKPTPQVLRSRHGVVYCGFRVLPGAILLSRRRKRRYAQRRRAWEQAYAHGDIDAQTLRQNMASVLAMTVHADAARWRAEQLRRCPVEPPAAWA